MSKQEQQAQGADGKKAAKTLTGKVVSSKMQKTIRVAVERYVPHATYGKYQRRTTNFLAHDENNESKEGDVVAIEECRPLSRHKAWRLVKVISRAAQAERAGEAS
jgi:small subunit ribosomal protein S17